MIFRIHGENIRGVFLLQRRLVFDDVHGVLSKALFLNIVEDDWETLIGPEQIPEILSGKVGFVNEREVAKHGLHDGLDEPRFAAITFPVEYGKQREVKNVPLFDDRLIAQVADQGRKVEPTQEQEIVFLVLRDITKKTFAEILKVFDQTCYI